MCALTTSRPQTASGELRDVFTIKQVMKKKQNNLSRWRNSGNVQIGERLMLLKLAKVNHQSWSMQDALYHGKNNISDWCVKASRHEDAFMIY